jgi:hypothetical protein
LGVTLSSDAKWNNHIENIILSVSRHLGILRKLKYRLSRQNLEKLYLVYIRPIFEYACEIWDNCGVCYSTKLEKLQLDAARIVTGLPIFTKTDKLYSETGWTDFIVLDFFVGGRSCGRKRCVRDINVSRARDPVHAGDKALTRETPIFRNGIFHWPVKHINLIL